jgi:hypothetical protein
MWENSTSKTPIFFDMFTGINTKNLQDLAYINGPGKDVMVDVCNSKQTGDFWTVSIPRNIWPRATGYLNEVLLKPYHEDVKSDPQLGKMIQTIAGAYSYQLYPITEQQAKLIPGNPMQDVVDAVKGNTLSTTIIKPSGATS